MEPKEKGPPEPNIDGDPVVRVGPNIPKLGEGAGLRKLKGLAVVAPKPNIDVGAFVKAEPNPNPE